MIKNIQSANCIYSKNGNNNADIYFGKKKSRSEKLAIKKEKIEAEFQYLPYKNIFPNRLTANIDKNKLLQALQNDKLVNNTSIAFRRISNFSKYLKEQMVGFITPEGEHWFEGACKFLILASAGVPIKESRYEHFAQDFWGLMANADPYWTSNEFINYLESMNKEDPGVIATLKTIKKMNASKKIKTSVVAFTSHYTSSLRQIKELIDAGCAYSGRTLNLAEKKKHPSIEHLFPHSAGGDSVNLNSNFVLTTSELNTLRGDIPLTSFLRGWDAKDFDYKHADWREENEPYIEYKNRLSSEERDKLKSNFNSNLIDDIKNDDNYELYDSDKAEKRIRSLSKYLKEEMIGFITPEGKEWFEGACTYIIKGTAGLTILEKDYKENAKMFWGLLAKADSYWASQDFINYLSSLNQNTGTSATIEAIKELYLEGKARNTQVSFGYSSQLRYIPELLKSCAYSNEPMNLINNHPKMASIEHIFPNSMGGNTVNDDCNYLLISAEENTTRGHLSLIEYLMGWNAIEFDKTHPGWLSKRVINAKKKTR